MKPAPRIPPLLLVFFGSYLLLGALSGMRDGNPAFVVYGVSLLLLAAVFTYLHLRFNLSTGLLWGLAVWGLLHIFGGLMPLPAGWPYEPPHAVLYSAWLVPDLLKYDHLVHAFGFGLTSWLCWQALRNGFRTRYRIELRPTAGVMALCALGGMGFGALNELIEFGATRLFSSARVGGYTNTGWDIFYNTIGTVVAVLLIWASHEDRTPRSVPRRRRLRRALFPGTMSPRWRAGGLLSRGHRARFSRRDSHRAARLLTAPGRLPEPDRPS